MDELETVPVRSPDPERYRSYLLRLWHETPHAPWRCQVHDVRTGLEQRFPDLANLFEFLASEAAVAAADGKDAAKPQAGA